MLPQEQLVPHEAQAVDVASSVHLKSVDLLRRHIGGGAQGRPGEGEAGVLIPGPGHSEIGESGGSHFFVDVDVLRLDVPVHDATTVGISQGRRDILQDRHGLFDREGPLLPQDLLQVAPGDMLHEQGEAAIRETMRSEELDDVGVGELSHEACFPLETGESFLIPPEAGPDDFQCHVPLQTPVPQEVHHGCSSPADFPDELEITFEALDGLLQLLRFVHRLR